MTFLCNLGYCVWASSISNTTALFMFDVGDFMIMLGGKGISTPDTTFKEVLKITY